MVAIFGFEVVGCLLGCKIGVDAFGIGGVVLVTEWVLSLGRVVLVV